MFSGIYLKKKIPDANVKELNSNFKRMHVKDFNGTLEVGRKVRKSRRKERRRTERFWNIYKRIFLSCFNFLHC
jgi:hypothetical protein